MRKYLIWTLLVALLVGSSIGSTSGLHNMDHLDVGNSRYQSGLNGTPPTPPSASVFSSEHIVSDLTDLGWICDGRYARFSRGDVLVVVSYNDTDSKYYLSFVDLEGQLVYLSLDVGYTYYGNSLDIGNYDIDSYDEVAFFNSTLLSIYDENGALEGSVYVTGTEIASHDLNMDGISEIIVIASSYIYVIDTTLCFIIQVIDVGEAISNVAFGDINCDGFNDIIVLSQTALESHVIAYSGFNYSILGNISLNIDLPYGLYSDDYNFDGYSDIVAMGENNIGNDVLFLIQGRENIEIRDTLLVTEGDIDQNIPMLNNYYYSVDNDRFEFIFILITDKSNLYRVSIDWRGMYFDSEIISDVEITYFLFLASGYTNFTTPAALIISEQSIYCYSIQPFFEVMETNYPYYSAIYAFTYDHNKDNRNDVCFVSTRDVRTYIADATPPEIIYIDVNPMDATTDDAITINVITADNSTLISAYALIYGLGSPFYTDWPLFPKEVIGNIYVWETFITGLMYGSYVVNVTVKDSFGNTASLNGSKVVLFNIHGVVYEDVQISSNVSFYTYYLDILDMDGDGYDETVILIYENDVLNISILGLNDCWSLEFMYIHKFYNMTRSLFKTADINYDGYPDIIGVLENESSVELIYVYGTNTTPIIESYEITGVGNITSLGFATLEHRLEVIIGTENGVFYSNGTMIVNIDSVDYVICIDREDILGELAILTSNFTGIYIMIYNVVEGIQEYFDIIIENFSLMGEINTGYRGEVKYGSFLNSNELLIYSEGAYEERSILIYDLADRSVTSQLMQNNIELKGAFDFDEDGLEDIVICDMDYNIIIYNGTFSRIFKKNIGTQFEFVHKFDWNDDGEEELATMLRYETTSTLIIIDPLGQQIRGFDLKGLVIDYKPLYMIPESQYKGIIGLFYREEETGGYSIDLYYMIDIATYYIPLIDINLSSHSLMQDQTLRINVSAIDFFGKPIEDAQCLLNVTSRVGSFTYVLLNIGHGMYKLDIPVNNWGIGIVNISISFSHTRYHAREYRYSIIVYGKLEPIVSYPYIVSQGEHLIVIIDVYDENLNPVYNNEVYLIFNGETLIAQNLGNNTYAIQIDTSILPIGEYQAILEIYNPYAEPKLETINILVTGEVNVEITGRGLDRESAVVQGENIPVRVNLFDGYGYPLIDATVSALFYGRFYGFYSYNNGTYSAMISSENVHAGVHKCFISISHPIIGLIEKNLSLYILGYPRVDLYMGEGAIVQDTYRLAEIAVSDKYDYPATGLNVLVSLANRTYEAWESDEEAGLYYANISLYGLHHGYYDLKVIVTGQNYIQKTYTIRIYVDVKLPELSITYRDFIALLAISFIISIVGLLMYYRLTRILRMKKEEAVGKSIKIMNKLYIAVLVMLGISMFYSYSQYSLDHHGAALLGIVLCLLLTILLSALWIYRDINKNILLERFHKSGMLLGLWHLLLVPVLLYMIFYIGSHIEWFYVHIVEDIISIGGYSFPKLLLSILGTYIGSYVVIVINIYRESNKVVNKVKYMREHETAEQVITKEKEYNITKLTDSIRTKFLVFLVIIGATIITTTKLLQYYAIGLVVVIPMIIIFVIPYLASKALKILSGERGTLI